MPRRHEKLVCSIFCGKFHFLFSWQNSDFNKTKQNFPSSFHSKIRNNFPKKLSLIFMFSETDNENFRLICAWEKSETHLCGNHLMWREQWIGDVTWKALAKWLITISWVLERNWLMIFAYEKFPCVLTFNEIHGQS